MSNQPVPVQLGRSPALDISSLPSQSPPASFWDRLSTWASENKALVYTITGVAIVVTGAGVAYYLTDSRRASATSAADGKRKTSKKERRKAKKEKEKEEPEKDTTAREQPTESGMAIQTAAEDTANRMGSEAKEKQPTVESEPLEALPQVDESTVGSLSEQVVDYANMDRISLIEPRNEKNTPRN